MKRRALLRVGAAAAAVAAVPRRLLAEDTLRVISLPIDTGLEVLYGERAGIAKQLGIAIDNTMMNFGAASQSALVGGAADVVNSNVASLVIAREKGVPLVLLAPGGLYSTKEPTSVLVVARDSSAKDARDLNGKIIAVNGLNSLSQFAAEAWVDANGGDSKTARWVDMPFSEMAPALSAHRIDAALLAEPQVTIARDTTRMLGKAYDAIAPKFVISVWVSTRAWVASNPDLARRFATLIYRTATWANGHRPATAEVLTSFTHLDPVLARSMNRIEFADSRDPALVQPQIDACLKYGAIAKPVAAAELYS